MTIRGEDKQIAAGYINKVIEREILRAPEQYLWVHRRFKNPPAGRTFRLLTFPHRLRFQNPDSWGNVSRIMF
ncbi:putative lipid A biosynthesis acyltransferase [Klebsiella pneumoniae]|nr:putative lipid A biosynthesis acyltransferase [Klebsiella pneumoniae]